MPGHAQDLAESTSHSANPSMNAAVAPAAAPAPRHTRWLALVVLTALVCSGCFGYNRSAKRTAYLGDTVLILGGGGTLAAELLLGEEDCEGMGCVEPISPITGPLVAGTMLVTAGLVGLVLNLTRPIVKTSR